MATTSELILVQEFRVYNNTGQRMMFRGLIIPPKEMRVTTDATLFEDNDVKIALDRKAIEVDPDPRNFYSSTSGIPISEGGGGGGGGGGGANGENLVRSFTNNGGLPMKRGAPIYSGNPNQANLAVGNLVGRAVIGLYMGAIDLPPGASGDFLLEGSLFSNVAQWQDITDMPGGLVRGKKYFLDITIEGKLRLAVNLIAPPVGSYQVCVGYALTSTEFKLEIQTPIRIA